VPVNLWAFAAVVAPLVATPGASTAVVLRNSLAGGVRSGVATAIGANAGSIAYGLLTASGVSIALQQWPVAWAALRGAGVVYLALLGLRSLRRALRPGPQAFLGGRTVLAQASPTPRPLTRDAREGFFTNALNPSIATLYLLVLPQFIPRGAPFAENALLLTAVHVGLAISWHCAWAAAGGVLVTWLTGSRPRRILEGITGVALLALAVTIAT